MKCFQVVFCMLIFKGILRHIENSKRNYPNKEVASELAHSFEFGFPIHYVGSRLPKESKNLKSANDHPDVV